MFSRTDMGTSPIYSRSLALLKPSTDRSPGLAAWAFPPTPIQYIFSCRIQALIYKKKIKNILAVCNLVALNAICTTRTRRFLGLKNACTCFILHFHPNNSQMSNHEQLTRPETRPKLTSTKLGWNSMRYSNNYK